MVGPKKVHLNMLFVTLSNDIQNKAINFQQQ